MDYTDIVPPTGTLAACARFDAQCGGYMERDLDQAEQAWMMAHQSECAACAVLVGELEAIMVDSKALPGISPSRDLWSGIEARLDTVVIPISAATAPAMTRTRTARTVSVRTFAIAATMLMAVTSGITWRLAARGNAVTTSPAVIAAAGDRVNEQRPPDAPVEIAAISPSTTSAAPAASASRAATRFVARDVARDDMDADVVYEREISALRRIVDDREVELDSVTVRELRRNLNIIDRAIGDSRKALARDPRSTLLATELDRALETKLALLRRVALL